MPAPVTVVAPSSTSALPVVLLAWMPSPLPPVERIVPVSPVVSTVAVPALVVAWMPSPFVPVTAPITVTVVLLPPAAPVLVALMPTAPETRPAETAPSVTVTKPPPEVVFTPKPVPTPVTVPAPSTVVAPPVVLELSMPSPLPPVDWMAPVSPEASTVARPEAVARWIASPA